MSSEEIHKFEYFALKIVVIFIIIGLVTGSLTNNMRNIITLFWIGVGLAGLFLLARLVIIAEKILHEIE
ncbi:hypothetical protein [Natronobacterium lacisalsi]|uniref:hypothetical protein n=1 Tax=Natronobacterium lacisalsi TaxID=229731 RepID=UPI001268840A|nr:hypothetical protein [Halobiforma lacisalsi]